MAPHKDHIVQTSFERYRRQLQGYLYRMLRSTDDAEDLVQETFLKFHAAEPALVRSPRMYLFTTAYHLALNVLARRKVVAFESGCDHIIDSAPHPGLDVEESLLQNERLDTLVAAINQLPPQCRRVFVLRKIEHLPHDEIAARLGISVSTVQKHLTKALRTCRAAVRHHDNKRDDAIPAQEA